MKMVRLCYLKGLKKYTELILITLHILDVYKLLKATYVKWGLTVESNSSTDLTKTLKIIYSQQKGSRLYYEMLTQGKDKPKCCEKWEAKIEYRH